YVPLVVRQDDRASALLLQTSVNTYEAYNAWGGKSLYDSNSSGAATVGGGTAAVKVSFNRPYEADFGSGHFLRYEYNLIRWIERQGYDVTYTTDADVAVDGTQLLRHRALIAAGHDEYWTAEQRQHVEEALSQGVHLAFLGADDVYWQARYEASAEAVPYRTLVVYRGHSDPLFSTDLAHTTVRWRDQPVTKPENSLTGTSYGGQLNPFVQDWVAAGTANWLFAGAWLRPGDKVPGLVGKEYDHSVNNEASPKGLQILSHSPVSTNGGSGTDGYAETTVYTAPSGAMVFGAGTVTWSWGLDDASYPLGALHSTPVSAAIQRITANLLDYFAYGPPDPP
ncbi:MAG: N,N-dimethylformamidase beta subunit family domain-containing protein, partial [Dehalococcoidia bacterium]